MGIARSTYDDRSQAQLADTALVQAIAGICDAFEADGWRRVRAALPQQGIVASQADPPADARARPAAEAAPAVRADDRP
jgi:hypothetical protein